MQRGIIYIIFILNFLIPSSIVCQVNVKAAVDKNRILIGEPVKLILEAYVPLGQPVVWFPVDTIPHFEFINKAKIDTAESIEGKKFTQHLSITSFDSGHWLIPQLELKVGAESYFTDTIPIDITFAAFNPEEGYRDIKDISEVVNPLVKYIPWIIAGVAFISLLLLVYFLRNRKPEPAVSKRPVFELSPFDQAMQSLTVIRKKGLPQNGQVKGYYTELNDILRVFILRKLNIATMEKTNDELILQLMQLNIPKDSFTRLAQTLRMSDFVKFAQYQPPSSDNEENLEIIESAIRTLNTVE